MLRNSLSRPDCLCGVLTLIPLFLLHAQTTEPAFSLSVKVEAETVRPGSDVTLLVVVTNKTSQQILFPMDQYHPAGAFTVNVTDPAGQPAGKTRLYRAVSGDRTGKDASEPPPDPLHETLIIGSGVAGQLDPGEKREHLVVLNRKNSELFDLRKPGKYTVQVERMDNASKTIVKSNVAEFTITN